MLDICLLFLFRLVSDTHSHVLWVRLILLKVVFELHMEISFPVDLGVKGGLPQHTESVLERLDLLSALAVGQ